MWLEKEQDVGIHTHKNTTQNTHFQHFAQGIWVRHDGIKRNFAHIVEISACIEIFVFEAKK